MPKWLKVVLLISVFGCVISGLAIAVAVKWFRGNMDGWAASAKAKGAEGAAFGSGKPSDACVAEAVSRLKANSSFADELSHKFFLRGCLGAATQPTGYCDAVPSKNEIISSVAWSLKKCTALDMLDDQACQRLVQTIQEHCHEGAQRIAPTRP